MRLNRLPVVAVVAASGSRDGGTRRMSIESKRRTSFFSRRVGTADLPLETLDDDPIQFGTAVRIERRLARGGKQDCRVDPVRVKQGIECGRERGAVLAVQFAEKKNIAVYLPKFPVRQCPRALVVTAGP